MTTTVIVKVPGGASYVARVTTFETANKRIDDVQPGAEQTFYAGPGLTVSVTEAPIEAAENPDLPA